MDVAQNPESSRYLAKSKGKMHHSHPCEHCPFLGSEATAVVQQGNGNEGESHMHGRKETAKRSKQPLFELEKLLTGNCKRKDVKERTGTHAYRIILVEGKFFLFQEKRALFY